MGSWVLDAAGCFPYWSHELFHIYGLGPAKQGPSFEEYVASIHPQDREFMRSLINRMIAEARPALPYVVVWVADDPDDRDGDPGRDSNDIVIVRSCAFGVRGARRTVEATILRESAQDGAVAGGVTRSDVSMIAWREVR